MGAGMLRSLLHFDQVTVSVGAVTLCILLQRLGLLNHLLKLAVVRGSHSRATERCGTTGILGSRLHLALGTRQRLLRTGNIALRLLLSFYKSRPQLSTCLGSLGMTQLAL